jgi:lipopolysaccharide transport system permease protein
VKKISLRREVFPLSSIVISLLDFLIASFILIGMMIWFRVPITVNIFWVLPLILLLSLLSAGVGFFVAAFGTYRRDIIYAIPFLMQFWLLASPVMYPLGQVPERWKSFYAVNPLVGLIEGFREVLVRGSPPNEGLLLTSIVGIMIILLISWPLFRYMSQYFADVL